MSSTRCSHCGWASSWRDFAFLDRLSSGPAHDRWAEVHEYVKSRRRR